MSHQRSRRLGMVVAIATTAGGLAPTKPARGKKVEVDSPNRMLAVTKDPGHQVTSDERSTDFLKRSSPIGVWAGLCGVGNGTVVRAIHTGIWPESASFAAPASGGRRQSSRHLADIATVRDQPAQDVAPHGHHAALEPRSGRSHGAH